MVRVSVEDGAGPLSGSSHPALIESNLARNVRGAGLLLMQFGSSAATVLVLSDDPSFAMLVGAVTGTAGAVRRTNTSKVREDLAHDPRPSVLVLDITIDTAQLRWRMLDELAADPLLSEVPIVLAPAASQLLAGHADALQRPALPVWSEPFDPGQLLAAIERVQ